MSAPPDALRLPVNADLAEASLETALDLIGNPERFALHVHTRANHYAAHIAFKDHHEDKTYKWKFQIVEEPSYEEFEWMVSDLEGKRVWVAGA